MELVFSRCSGSASVPTSYCIWWSHSAHQTEAQLGHVLLKSPNKFHTDQKAKKKTAVKQTSTHKYSHRCHIHYTNKAEKQIFSCFFSVERHSTLKWNLKRLIDLRGIERVNNKRILVLLLIPFSCPIMLRYRWPELGGLMTKCTDCGEGLFLNRNGYIIKSESISHLKEKEENDLVQM